MVTHHPSVRGNETTGAFHLSSRQFQLAWSSKRTRTRFKQNGDSINQSLLPAAQDPVAVGPQSQMKMIRYETICQFGHRPPSGCVV
jgi:hypothetical protein